MRVKAITKFVVEDVEEPYEKRELSVERESYGISVNIPGYGTPEMMPGAGPVVLVEFRNGVPFVLVWADITIEEPTHVVSLAGASEKLREN